MICSKCGNQVQDGARFCSECGATLGSNCQSQASRELSSGKWKSKLIELLGGGVALIACIVGIGLYRLVNSGVQDFIKSEGTPSGVSKAKITDWAAYVEKLDAEADQMTEIQKKELCVAEIGRPVEIEIVVKDVSEMSDEDGNPICVISSWLELQGGIRNVYVYVCNAENTCETYAMAKNLTKDSRIIVSGAVLFLDGPVILGVDPRIVCHQIKLAGAR